MVDRVWFVGSNEMTAPQIEAGFLEMLGLLEKHLATRPYLFGGRPAFGDFGLWGQIYEMWTDPTAGALIGGNAPHVLDWIHRMLWPRAEGAFESWTALAPTLMPILVSQVGQAILAVDRSPTRPRSREARRNSASRSATRSGPRSRRNITRDRSACCAPNTPKSPTRARSTWCWPPRVASPDCAPRYQLPYPEGQRHGNP